MSKKVYLSPSDQTRNTYAYGNTTEAIQCGKIAEACKVALERNGVSVKIGHMISMAQKCSESNAFGADLHVPIHTNAFNGSVMGTRMFCWDGGEGYKACKAIFSVLAPISPGSSESITINKSLYEVKTPNAPTAYIECEFHDNKEGAEWLVKNTVLIGETIAKGICNYFGIAYKASGSTSKPTQEHPTKPTQNQSTSNKELYRVRKSWADAASQIGAFAVLENAIKVCKTGYSVFDSKGNVVYPKAQPAPTKKSVDEIAREVIRGDWGNGSDRTKRLSAAGYDANVVQNRVNEILGGSSTPKKSIDEVAREVIRGEWGNGADRKNRLVAAGYNYDAVQNRVNEIL